MVRRGVEHGSLPLFGRDIAGQWHEVGELRAQGSGYDRDDMIERLAAGAFEKVEPRYKALQIEDLRLEPRIR
ncbi:hypothetical protein D3C77_749240 [compost metagenome]